MSKERQEFIETVAEYAIAASKQSRILPSLTIAQAILESKWGQSELARKSKNLFGIKGDGDAYETEEEVNGKRIKVTANFRKYDTFEGSVRDHNAMLARMKRYRALIGEKDYKKACYAIYAAGYATDSKYPEKLISVIEAYNLFEYDKERETVRREDANAIIRYLQLAWGAAKTPTEKAEIARLANALRTASGQQTQ